MVRRMIPWSSHEAFGYQGMERAACIAEPMHKISGGCHQIHFTHADLIS